MSPSTASRTSGGSGRTRFRDDVDDGLGLTALTKLLHADYQHIVAGMLVRTSHGHTDR
jgi:hypothetical protein